MAKIVLQGGEKKAQNMSVELIFTVSLFVGFFVLMLAVILSQQSSDLDDVSLQARDLVTKVSDPVNPPVRIVRTDGSIDVDKLIEISNLTGDELKELFGINSEFCFVLQNVSGDVINITPHHTGVGSNKILIGGVPCGYNP
jgi:hypothetical protein